MRYSFLLILAIFASGCGGAENTNSAANAARTSTNTEVATVPSSTYEIVNTFPHDPKAFTQGLVYHGGFLYESTGQEGASSLRKVEITTGKVLQKYDLPDDVFGEGLAIFGGEVYQLSWRHRMGWVYALDDFKLLREFHYSGEGWGLTNDDTQLFMSDGTHVIRVVEPEKFRTVRTLVIRDEAGRPLSNLNELEYVKGEIWANIWHSEEIGKPNHIARLDPSDGRLLGWIDLRNISPEDQKGSDKREHTLNGIAYDAEGDRIFVTGKYWKNLYEIRLKPQVTQ